MPTKITLGSDWLTSMAPTLPVPNGCPSEIGSQDTPASTVFQTPPPVAPK
jgi:hypothetical protein